MSTRTTPPTEEEVLAALEKATIHNEGKDWGPASRVDVADSLARMRGWDGKTGLDRTPAGHYPTRGTVIGKWVSINAVQAVLDILKRQDKAYAFYGRHRFLAGRYGVIPGHVYYLSQQALDLLLQKQRKLWESSAGDGALYDAQQWVLAEHKDQVESLRNAYLADRLKEEPDWQAMLNEDD